MPNTDELRQQIEVIDEQIIKKKSSQQYWDDEKEREVVQRYHELCEEVSLSETEAKQIAEVILHISKERQKHIFRLHIIRMDSCSIREQDIMRCRHKVVLCPASRV